MKYAPKKVFILENGNYKEITYAELCRLTENESVLYADKLFIPLHGMLMEVSEDTYRDFYKNKRRQKYLYEQSEENGDISYDMLTTDEFSGEDILIDSSEDIAVQVEHKIMADKLKQALFGISDEALLGGITELLNSLIAKPERITIPAPVEYEPSAELRRLNHEIGRSLDGFSIQKETLRKQLLQSVSLKYEGIDNAVYTAGRLKADFANASPLSDFSPELFNRTVSELRLCENGSVILTLTNGQQIGKEQNDGSDNGTAADTSGAQNTADR